MNVRRNWTKLKPLIIAQTVRSERYCDENAFIGPPLEPLLIPAEGGRGINVVQLLTQHTQ